MMNTLRTLLYTWLMMLTLFTSDVEVFMFGTKLPYYNRGTLPAPIKPPDFCMSGLCPPQNPHIACQMPFWGPQCGKPRFGINMEANQHIILNLHNELRMLLSYTNRYLPVAKDMNILRWDDNLSLVAMRVTNYCQKVDGFCLNVPLHLNVGKNDFISKRQSVIPKVPIILKHIMMPFKKLIFEEIRVNHVHSFPSNATQVQKTLAQMISSSATSIGCGMLMRFQQTYSTAYLTCLYDNKVVPGDRLYSTN